MNFLDRKPGAEILQFVMYKVKWVFGINKVPVPIVLQYFISIFKIRLSNRMPE